MMQIDWVNTPGGFYAFAYWLALGIMILYGKRRYDTKKSVLINILFGALLVIAMTVTHGLPQIYFVPLMVLFIVILWTDMYIVCTYDTITTLYYAMRAFVMGEFIASMEWMLYFYLIEWKLIPQTRLTSILVLLVVDGILGAFFTYLERRNKDVNQNITISPKELISMVLISLGIYAASNINYVFEEARISSLVITQLFLVRTMVDMGGVAILYAYHVQMGELNARFEVERLQDMLEMQAQNYAMLEQSVAAVNQKYHDLKYQINLLRSEAGSGASLTYLDQMEQDIKAYEAQNKTGNKVLDTILTGKTLYCQTNWIDLTAVADGAALDFMDPMDISTLFGNMIDNAIEAVSKIEAKEKRLIHLAVTKQKGFLRIRMENCVEEIPEFENGLPKTTKKDKKYHGFGVKSIQNTVKKYGGSVTMQAENGWFELRILIPMHSGGIAQ